MGTTRGTGPGAGGRRLPWDEDVRVTTSPAGLAMRRAVGRGRQAAGAGPAAIMHGVPDAL